MQTNTQIFWKKLKTISYVAFNIIQLISSLLSIIVVISLGTLFAWFFRLQFLIMPAATFILGIITTIVLILFFVSKASLSRWLLRGYRQIVWESFYEIHEDDSQHHTFTIKVEIEAIEPGVHLFEDTFQWSGRGKEETPKILRPGQLLMHPVIPRSGWNYYYIHLGRDLDIGDRAEIELVQELYDYEHRFQPFLAKIISQPLDQLILQVKLPIKNLPPSINFTQYDGVGPASKIVDREPGHIDIQTGVISWKILRPVLRHRYEITWHP